MVEVNATRPVVTEPAYVGNSSFSTKVPGLQLVVDSTSLGEFKICPRRYQLGVVEGWQATSTSPHLTFGLLMHSGVEHYWRRRTEGQGHDAAVESALGWVLIETWDRTHGRPWVSGHAAKNRLSLIRALVWYLDEKAQNDPVETVVLGSGHPAVELSFQFELPYPLASSGEAFSLCGHIDRIGVLNGEPWALDIKTTTGEIGPRYMDGYSPDNQMSLYSFAGKVVWALPLRGILIDGVQVGATFARFHRFPVARDDSQLNEWFHDLEAWLAEMDRCAVANHWPMNDKACEGPYGPCQFREVCRRPPGVRQQFLQSNFVRRKWDPAKARTAPQTPDTNPAPSPQPA